MAVTIQVECSNHQSSNLPRTARIDVDTLDAETRDEVAIAISAQGWIVQFNGDNMDTYCSRKCAE